jgi:hypothetical protein
MNRDSYEKKLNKPNKKMIVTAVQLPSKEIETIINYNGLEEKAEYLLNAYDDNLCLKSFNKIKILDLIVISEADII